MANDKWTRAKVTIPLPPVGSEDREILMRLPFFTILTGMPLPPAPEDAGESIESMALEHLHEALTGAAEIVGIDPDGMDDYMVITALVKRAAENQKPLEHPETEAMAELGRLVEWLTLASAGKWTISPDELKHWSERLEAARVSLAAE